MSNTVSYLLANAYSSFSPMMNTASAVCSVNGQKVACPPFFSLFPIVFIIIGLFMIVSVWKVYSKAGQPGWASVIPIYNLVVMLQIVRKPIWWVILCFIPIVNIIVSFIVMHELAKAFGKSFGFTLGLIILPIIFYPILAFGRSQYVYASQQQML